MSETLPLLSQHDQSTLLHTHNSNSNTHSNVSAHRSPSPPSSSYSASASGSSVQKFRTTITNFNSTVAPPNLTNYSTLIQPSPPLRSSPPSSSLSSFKTPPLPPLPSSSFLYDASPSSSPPSSTLINVRAHSPSNSPTDKRNFIPSSSPSSSSSSASLSLRSPQYSPSPSGDSPKCMSIVAMLQDGDTMKLAIYLTTAIFLASANSITWKRTLNSFRSTDGSGRNLEFFVTQWTVFLYVVLAWLIMMYRWLFTNLISHEQRRFPTSKFAFMGFLDAGSGVCGAIGGAFVSGQLQNLLNQGNIPATMFMSYGFLGVRYTWQQFLGATIILCGALLAAIPSATGSVAEGTTWYGLVVLVFSLIPGSFSNVYKEANLKEAKLDVFYLTTVVSWWQVIIGFAFAPLLSLPGFGGISMSEIPQNFRQGWACFLGHPVRGYAGCSATPGPWYMLLVYVIINFIYNTLLLLITKHGSAVLLVIASALSMPITNFVFTSEFIMGDDAERLDYWTLGALGMVVVGFLMYSFVSDPDTGEIQIAQGPSGQMAFIMCEPPIKAVVRRRSFDMSDSPSVLAAKNARKAKALTHFYSSRNPEYRSMHHKKTTVDDSSVNHLARTP